MELITGMATVWFALFLMWALVNRGVPVFQELIRDMTDFFMEKALGPGADLFEGRAGAGTVSWMFHGMLWTCIGGTFSFIGLWMAHEPTAIASLSGIYYSPSPATVSDVGSFVASGGILMLLVGAGLHINSRLSGARLASDTNAVLTSFGYSTGLFLGFIGLHLSGDWGGYLGTAALVMATTSIAGVLANHLLTLGRRTEEVIQPSQWLILLGLGLPLVMTVLGFLFSVDAAILQSLATVPLLASALAVAFYVVPSEAGVPLWSRTLAGATVLLTFLTLSPIGVTGDLNLSFGGTAFLTILFAASLIPILAAAMNVFQTGRSNWGAASTSPASSAVMIGMFVLVASAVGSLFVGSDAHSNRELTHLQDPLATLFLWGAMGLIALGGVMTCFPAAAGRGLHSQDSSRLVLWMVGIGAVLTFLFSMSAGMLDSSMDAAIVANEMDADLVDMSSIGELQTLTSIAFYSVVIGMILMMLNMIRGVFSGTALESDGPDALTADRMALTPGSTTIRQLLSAGAGVDTEIEVICDTCGEEEE